MKKIIISLFGLIIFSVNSNGQEISTDLITIFPFLNGKINYQTEIPRNEKTIETILCSIEKIKKTKFIDEPFEIIKTNQGIVLHCNTTVAYVTVLLDSGHRYVSDERTLSYDIFVVILDNTIKVSISNLKVNSYIHQYINDYTPLTPSEWKIEDFPLYLCKDSMSRLPLNTLEIENNRKTFLFFSNRLQHMLEFFRSGIAGDI
jgi:hypothetical protein